MIPVKCRTNLDNVYELWPSELPAVPHVGDTIISISGKKPSGLELRVVHITWKYNKVKFKWYAEIELHLPLNRFENISDFEKWYLTGP